MEIEIEITDHSTRDSTKDSSMILSPTEPAEAVECDEEEESDESFVSEVVLQYGNNIEIFSQF